MKQAKAEKIIRGVEQSYDRIASQFSRTRYRLWPEMMSWREMIRPGQQVLDIGCGNGRLLELFADREVIYQGIDSAEALIRAARAKCQQYTTLTASFQVADMRALPFVDARFDSVFAVASLHHLPSEEFRFSAVTEMYRVIKPGGRLFMTNWYFWNRFTDRKFHVRKQVLMNWLRGLDRHDLYIPWKDEDGNVLTQRYYHAFKKPELRQLLEQAGWQVIDQQIVRREALVATGGHFESLVTLARKP